MCCASLIFALGMAGFSRLVQFPVGGVRRSLPARGCPALAHAIQLSLQEQPPRPTPEVLVIDDDDDDEYSSDIIQPGMVRNTGTHVHTERCRFMFFYVMFNPICRSICERDNLLYKIRINAKKPCL